MLNIVTDINGSFGLTLLVSVRTISTVTVEVERVLLPCAQTHRTVLNRQTFKNF